jgi:hypothetical protein
MLDPVDLELSTPLDAAAVAEQQRRRRQEAAQAEQDEQGGDGEEGREEGEEEEGEQGAGGAKQKQKQPARWAAGPRAACASAWGAQASPLLPPLLLRLPGCQALPCGVALALGQH